MNFLSKEKLPNLLTWSRVWMIPIIALLVVTPGAWTHYLSAALFCLVALTDWLDGYLARKWQVQSNFGAFLDPVADKLLVVVLLILLAIQAPGILMILSVLIIVSREIVISALREWMAGMGMRDVVQVAPIGKLKTTLQMIALLFLLVAEVGTVVFSIGLTLLVLAAVVTLVSMIQYLLAAASSLTSG
jgi:CDP-diacylglycerol---glycerol-3-phosphate 3-phosphatidyltransferase